MKSSLGNIPDALAQQILAQAGVNNPPPPIADTISEAEFQASIIGLAEDNGWKWHHATISKRSKEGWPDLVLCKRYLLIVELKVEPNKPTAAQLSWLDSLIAANVDARIWYPRDWSSIVETLTND